MGVTMMGDRALYPPCIYIYKPSQVKSGFVRSEDQKNVSRSIREHAEAAKQKLMLHQKEEGKEKEKDREKVLPQASTQVEGLQADTEATQLVRAD